MIPTPRIRTFGKLQIWDRDGKPLDLPTKKTELVLALLLISTAPVNRSELAETVWPDSPPEKARVSLRSALAAIRKALGQNTVSGESETIEIDRQAIEADIAQARRLQRLIALAPAKSELQSLQTQLAELTTRPLFEQLESPQVDYERDRWQEVRKTTLLDSAQAHLESGQPESALTAAVAAHKIDPLDETAIAAVMRVHVANNRSDLALKLSQDSAKLFKKELDVPLPRSLVQLTTEIKNGKFAPGLASAGLFSTAQERHLLAAIIQSGLEKDPEEILKLICAESFHPMAVHHLQDYLSILEQCLSATTGNSEGRLLAARTASRTASLLNDRAKTLTYANMVISNTEPDNPMHVAMISFVAYVYVEARKWDEARQYFEQALDLAKKNDYEYDITSTTLNLAMIKLENMDTEGTIEDILWAIERAKAENLSPFRTATALIYAVTHATAVGDYEQVVHYAEESLSYTNADPAFFNTASAKAFLGHAHAKLGRFRPALESAASALEIGYATGSPSRLQGVIEQAGLVLACAGKPVQGLWLRDAVLDSRADAEFPHSALENHLMADAQFSQDPAVVAKARTTNRLRHQPLATLVEFAIEECRRTLEEIA